MEKFRKTLSFNNVRQMSILDKARHYYC